MGHPFLKLQRALHEWYHAHGRKDLPWRHTSNPYEIYISEIMLQQTQVSTVLARYYHPFLKLFPTVKALADAPEQKVMKAWEGLGYYQRARNLHKAAKMAAGGMPKTVEGLVALPGIGQNTAHAIAAFAYHAPVPVLEANVKRVIARVFALEKPKDEELWEKAWALLDKEHPFDYNQAMMDIGAMICKPKAPLCLVCPLAIGCKGKTEPERYPGAKAAKKVPTRERIALILRNAKGEVGFIAEKQGRMLAGLEAFPQLEAAEWKDMKKQLKGAKKLGVVTHQYSHFTLVAEAWGAKVAKAPGNLVLKWVKASDIPALPLSKADRLLWQLGAS